METPIPAAPEPEPDADSIRWMKRGLVGFVGFAVLLGLYLGYWKLMAGQLDAGLDGWIADRQADGYRIRIDKRVLDGFPTRLRLRLEGIEIAGGDAKPWQWRAPRASASAPPWRLGRVDFDIDGVQRLREGAGGQARDTFISAERFGGSVGVVGKGGADLRLVVDGLVAERSKARFAASRRLDLDLAWRPLNGAREGASPLRFDLGIDGGTLPSAWTTPIGRRIETLRLRGRLSGPLAGGALEPALAAWRDAGGTLEIEQMSVTLGPLKFEAKGTAALDAQMQPEAAFSARAEGYLRTVDALVAARLMRPGEGTAAKLVLTVLAKRPAGRPDYLEAPLTLQDRTLSVGALRLMRLPRLDWSRLGDLRLPGGGG